MKSKILLFSAALLAVTGVFAQSNYASGFTSVGFTGGINWSTINGKAANGDDLDANLKTGFHGGINIEFPVSRAFYFQPGVEYRQKGASFSNGNTVRLSYIDIPVNVLFKQALGKGGMLFGFGPYVGIGLDGKVKSPDGKEQEISFVNKYSATEPEELQYKKIETGANFLVGYEFSNKLSAALKAQLGLNEINPETNIPEDKTRYRNTNFGVSLGYRL